jgi:CPA1 family monovalent cation:H+ antiporter
LPYLIKRSGLFNVITEEKEETARQRMRQGLRDHTYLFLKNKHENELRGHAGMEKLLHHWEEKSKASNDDWMNEKTKLIFFEMLESQRKFLEDLNKDPHIDEEIIREQLYLIDLEEERMKSM